MAAGGPDAWHPWVVTKVLSILFGFMDNLVRLVNIPTSVRWFLFRLGCFIPLKHGPALGGPVPETEALNQPPFRRCVSIAGSLAPESESGNPYRGTLGRKIPSPALRQRDASRPPPEHPACPHLEFFLSRQLTAHSGAHRKCAFLFAHPFHVLFFIPDPS
jgi:hypothetical protein